MTQEIFNYWSIVLQIIIGIFQIFTAIGLVWFAWRQTQINQRMQELADYVAVAIIPIPNTLHLQINNVGRSNLYLHKWEIGSLGETYVKPWLLPTSKGSHIQFELQPQSGQHLAKFYFTDEKDIKYISIGEVVIEPISFQIPPQITQIQPQQSLPQNQMTGIQPIVNIQLRMRAWAYKTEKYSWTI